MRPEDDAGVHQLSVVSFSDLERRLHEPPSPPPPPEPSLIRIRQLLERDPGGAWVAEDDGQLVGAALAIDREGVWGLSLLVVLPDHQSQGLGRELLERTLEYANGGERGAIILASPDSRALRAYARAGLEAHPSFSAAGHRGIDAPPATVRAGDADDLPLTEAVDRRVRGAPHGSDIAAYLRAGRRLFVYPERGYALLGDDGITLLAALDEEAARDVLFAALHAAAPDREIHVEWITAKQQWAVSAVLDAGLALSPGGAVYVRGDVGTFWPYLPSGAYL
jgi:GNAT superfamily N-acetyltransferase